MNILKPEISASATAPAPTSADRESQARSAACAGPNRKPEAPPKWCHTVALTHMLTTDSHPEAVSRSMNAVADVLERTPCFEDFAELDAFRHQEDCGQANWLLDILYDYCDLHRIWVE